MMRGCSTWPAVVKPSGLKTARPYAMFVFASKAPICTVSCAPVKFSFTPFSRAENAPASSPVPVCPVKAPYIRLLILFDARVEPRLRLRAGGAQTGVAVGRIRALVGIGDVGPVAEIGVEAVRRFVCGRTDDAGPQRSGCRNGDAPAPRTSVVERAGSIGRPRRRTESAADQPGDDRAAGVGPRVQIVRDGDRTGHDRQLHRSGDYAGDHPHLHVARLVGGCGDAAPVVWFHRVERPERLEHRVAGQHGDVDVGARERDVLHVLAVNRDDDRPMAVGQEFALDRQRDELHAVAGVDRDCGEQLRGDRCERRGARHDGAEVHHLPCTSKLTSWMRVVSLSPCTRRSVLRGLS